MFSGDNCYREIERDKYSKCFIGFSDIEGIVDFSVSRVSEVVKLEVRLK